jgi:hypothetical protein
MAHDGNGCAMDGEVRSRRIVPADGERYDMLAFLRESEQQCL